MSKNRKAEAIGEDEELIIRPSFTKNIEDLMLARGLDRLVLANKRSSFDLVHAITPFKPSVEAVRSKMMGPAGQLNTAKRLLDNPLKVNGLYVVNSFPTDLRAKIFASLIMKRGIERWLEMTPQERKGQSQPMWVRIMGGYGDHDFIKNLKAAKPNLLIITNINDESTQVKVERLRDVLEAFDDIPRVVVTAGSDPVTFMMKRVFYPLVGVVRIGSNEKVTLMDL